MSEYTFTVRLDTAYFAENWKHCSKIIFKYMKNYCLLFFYCNMNSALGAGLKKKKKEEEAENMQTLQTWTWTYYPNQALN